ncbi:MAG: MFS transporter, partial [Burkholderiales bacterium]
MTTTLPAIPESRRSGWSGVFALSLAAFALVASEFMPVSLLTPLASDFQITEGQAGLAISVSGAFALLTSLTISRLTGRTDRKLVLLGLSFLMLVSGAIAA